MNQADNQWDRLVRAARSAVDARDVTAPYGFSTRVAAQAMTRERSIVSVFERFSLRALCVAGLLALVCTAANYSLFNSATDDDPVTDDSTVSALLDFSS